MGERVSGFLHFTPLLLLCHPPALPQRSGGSVPLLGASAPGRLLRSPGPPPLTQPRRHHPSFSLSRRPPLLPVKAPTMQHLRPEGSFCTGLTHATRSGDHTRRGRPPDSLHVPALLSGDPGTSFNFPSLQYSQL